MVPFPALFDVFHVRFVVVLDELLGNSDPLESRARTELFFSYLRRLLLLRRVVVVVILHGVGGVFLSLESGDHRRQLTIALPISVSGCELCVTTKQMQTN